MPGTLVIGYGYALRGDDGFGWRVAEQLANLAGGAINVVAVHQLTPELAELISQAELIIFVDAGCQGKPGSWRCETVRAEPVGCQSFGHYFSPTGLLSYASAIFNTRPAALLISVTGSSFDCSDRLSPIMAEIVPEVTRHLFDLAGTTRT